MRLTTHQIKGDTPSSSFQIPVYECGPVQAETVIYLQAGMHADEHPGMMVLHHLLDQLEVADAAGLLKARFIILPVVNPLGLAHLSFHSHAGRYHPVNALNYNRGWPDFAALIASESDITDKFGDDAAANRSLVRDWLQSWLAAQTPHSALEQQRHIVMGYALQADMVLDLHCDDLALNHIFTVPQNLPEMQRLADWMGSAATLVAEDSGGGSFDEVWSGMWISLARRYPEAAWDAPVISATLEYRGQQDVSDAQGFSDARNLYHFFCEEGAIDEAPTITRPTAPAATRLDACDIVRVTQSGLLAYEVSLGDIVKTGDVIATLIQLDGDAPARTRHPILAGTDGVVFTINQMKYVWPGVSIAKIAGQTPLESRTGYLLED